MTSYRHEITQSWVRREPSARALAQLLGLGSPVTLKDVVTRLREVETIFLEKPVHTDDDAAINARVAMRLRSNGEFEFSGQARATGLPSYDFGMQAWVTSGGRTLVAAQEHGTVHSVRSWHQKGFNPAITDGWRELRASPQLGYTFHADIGGVLGSALDVLEFALKGIVANVVMGPYGWYVLIGNELAGLDTSLTSPDVLAGILVSGGVYLIAGPVGLIPAIIAGVATAKLVNIEHRPITGDEIDFAKKVFGDKIRYEDILITNMVDLDGNCFTWPGVGNQILMGLGRPGQSYKDPMLHGEPGTSYAVPGSMFIHELTHAWQICNGSLMRVVCHRGGSYDFGSENSLAGQSWRNFENEAQGAIVDSWFSKFHADLDSVAALNDPRYRFIRDNIRLGVV